MRVTRSHIKRGIGGQVSTPFDSHPPCLARQRRLGVPGSSGQEPRVRQCRGRRAAKPQVHKKGRKRVDSSQHWGRLRPAASRSEVAPGTWTSITTSSWQRRAELGRDTRPAQAKRSLCCRASKRFSTQHAAQDLNGVRSSRCPRCTSWRWPTQFRVHASAGTSLHPEDLEERNSLIQVVDDDAHVVHPECPWGQPTSLAGRLLCSVEGRQNARRVDNFRPLRSPATRASGAKRSLLVIALLSTRSLVAASTGRAAVRIGEAVPRPRGRSLPAANGKRGPPARSKPVRDHSWCS